MLRHIPLLIIPLIVYNIQIFYFGDGTNIWGQEVISLLMISGQTWTMTMGDIMIAMTLGLLFIEIIKATRVGSLAIFDHMLSMFVFIGFLVEFLMVPEAVHSVFFILTVIALIDVLAGFVISIRSATRDISVGHGAAHYVEN